MTSVFKGCEVIVSIERDIARILRAEDGKDGPARRVMRDLMAVDPQVRERMDVSFLPDGGVQVSMHGHHIKTVVQMVWRLGLSDQRITRHDHEGTPSLGAYSVVTWAEGAHLRGGLSLCWFFTEQDRVLVFPDRKKTA